MPPNSHYFSHDYNAHSDYKIIMLRQKFRMEGYGIYWFLVEHLAMAGGRLPVNVVAALSEQMGADEETVRSVILDFDLFVIEDNLYYSERLVEHLELRDYLSREGRKGALKRWGGTKKPSVLQISKSASPEEKPQYQTPTRGNDQIGVPDESVVSWRNIANYEYADMDEWIRGNYTEIEFNAFVSFNKWINDECPSLRERTDKQIEFKHFVKMFRKMGGNKAAAEAIKDAMVKVAGGTINQDHDLYSRLQMYLKSPLNNK